MESDGTLPYQYIKLMDNFDNVYSYGLSSNFHQNSVVGLEFQLNTALYTSKNLLGINNTRMYSLSPGIFAEISLKSLPKFHPYIGLGHTTFFIGDGNKYVSEQSIETVLGIRLKITTGLYIKLEYAISKMIHHNTTSTIYLFFHRRFKYKVGISILNIKNNNI